MPGPANALNIAQEGLTYFDGDHTFSGISTSAASTGDVLTVGTPGDPASFSAPSAGYSIVNVTGTSQTIAPNTIYFANNSSQVVFSLPATMTQGQSFGILGVGAGGWKITQNSGQQIQIGAETSTSGASGTATSGTANDGLLLYCVTTNDLFKNLNSPQGTIALA